MGDLAVDWIAAAKALVNSLAQEVLNKLFDRPVSPSLSNHPYPAQMLLDPSYIPASHVFFLSDELYV